ncbi:MAG TPA: hypothetical protein VKA84_21805, partial [Gemmatimonadaceae bacterium]|nr:hypothetical protein [Gemmatimonadaceae bacterium]
GGISGAAANAAARDEVLGAEGRRERRKAMLATADSASPPPSARASVPAAAPLTRRDSQDAAEAARATAAARAESERERQTQRTQSVRLEELQRLDTTRRALRPGDLRAVRSADSALQRVLASQASLRGCYELRLDRWTPAPPAGGGAGSPLPPRRIELTGEPAPPAAGAPVASSLVRAPDDAAAGAPRLAFWHLAAGDSVEVVWSDGTRGVRLRLAPDAAGTTLRGEARTFSDTPGPEQRARALARKAACAP